ncbi:hypothetical protein VDGE_03945 [Verticillium dahliae]|uniref:Rpb7-binding protein seb1 n=1 Tax=Verticillium dahliae TaxID=27337 RepID=A0A444S0W8_VERDA|nr:hypothetical protein VDGE_03945 [Verticillium dahliae]
MASPVAELEAGLQAMSHLKPPGVSGSRISSITALCVGSVQSESVLIQKIYTHFKKTAGDHKLGVLYVVDSVTRKWLERAKSSGQDVDGSATDGTFAAGVHRVTELMPVLMNDIVQSAPENHKEKISKLLDIWEKAQTFPQSMIDSFRTKLATPPVAAFVKSMTPEGSPPPGLLAFLGLAPSTNAAKPPAAPPSSNAIMEALANIARTNGPASQQHVPTPAHPPPTAAPSALNGLAGLLNTISQRQPAPQATNALPPSYSVPPPPPAAASGPAPPMPYAYPPQAAHPPAHNQQAPPPAFSGLMGTGYPGVPPPPAAPQALTPDVQQQVMLIKALAEQGVPFDQIPALINTMQQAGVMPHLGGPAAPAAQPPYPAASAPTWGAAAPATSNGHADSRDRYGYNGGQRSPDRYPNRSRSRSPGRRWDSRDKARNGRDDFGHRQDDAGRSSEYRQRSPAGRRASPSGPPQHSQYEKWVEYDRTLPEGKIRVYSRTLFVGGVTCSEPELRNIFTQYGQVQTCIVNKDKRHAFVKMLTRKDAEAAKEALEFPQGPEGLQLRTRWGVGFGPRQCSDYSTGISIIPISELTEADRKWMLTAEYGGSGGKPIETGLVVEEPDIEIGAGVSSKAISRRMQTDKGGSHGPKSSHVDDRWRRKNGGGHGGRDRRDDMKLSGANSQPIANNQFVQGNGFNGMPSASSNYGGWQQNSQ